uniref:Putative reverse transcriptase-rnase h-integrase n=1 Tax=Moniliophthora roreri TaxID=221103 RepID=A0A0W0ETR3_MONRR
MIQVPSLRTFVMQIQTVQNFGWHMQPTPNEFRMLLNWPANNLSRSPPSPHPALVYLGHLIEPDQIIPFIPETNQSPPPLQVLPPSSIPTLQAPPVMMTPLMMDLSLSSTFPPLNQEAPLSMPPPSESKPRPLLIQVPRPSNLIWRVSTPQEYRNVTTVTSLPRYCSMQTVSSTPIFNPSESLLPLTEPPQNPSLAN